MKKFVRMSEAEAEVMRLVWDADDSVSSANLIEALTKQGKAWKPTTMLTFLARLIEKGILTSVKHGRANEYIPIVSEAEYKRYETRSFLDSVHDGSVKNFITALYDGDELTTEEIRELQEWFSQRGTGE